MMPLAPPRRVPRRPARDLRPSRRLLAVLALLALASQTGCRPGEANAEGEPAALPVETSRIEASDHYTVTSRHVGRVLARREADLGFTRSDRLVEVMVHEGDHVDLGAPLARLETAQLEAQRNEWRAQRSEVQARLDLARLTLDRRKQLAGKDSISTERYDEARFEVIALEARLASIEAGLARVMIDLAESTLAAPFAGSIIRRSADEGAILAPGAPVVSMIESDAMEVRVGVPSALAARLSVGDTHAVEIDGGRHPATVRAILDDIDAATRTVTIVLAFALPSPPDMRHGELARLVVEERREAEGYWLPITALTESRRGLWSAYALEPGDAADVYVVARHELMMLHVESDRAFVRGTLSDGDEVVASGLQRIAPGQRVRRATRPAAAR